MPCVKMRQKRGKYDLHGANSGNMPLESDDRPPAAILVRRCLRLTITQTLHIKAILIRGNNVGSVLHPTCLASAGIVNLEGGWQQGP
jgi:hypothetical protein